MKLIIILFSWLMIVSESFAMSDSLKKLIKSMNSIEDGEMFYDQRMIAAWPDLESEVALNEILDELLKPGRNEYYSEETQILDTMKFPREKIVGMILEKVKDRQTPEEGLGRAFGLAQYYTDDERIFSYLVGFINDTRLVGRRPPATDADYGGVTERICDDAAGIIRECLQKRGLLKPGDPEWGESGGISSYPKADSALILLKEFLVKNQLMTVEQSLARPKKEAEMSNSSMDPAPDSKLQIRESKRPESVIESTKQVSPWLWIWIGIAAILGAFGLRLLIRRSE